MDIRLNNNAATKTSRAIVCPLIIAMLFLLSFICSNIALAENGERQIGVRGFLDEDGDGFNDLIPDSDGDGVPNPIDPDWRGHAPDTISMRREMFERDDTAGAIRHNMMGPGYDFMDRHGEPGMYGPGDTTGHGGMRGDSSGHHRGDWPPPDSGGHHGDWPPPDSGGHHGGWPPPDTMGMGPGRDRPIMPSDGSKETKDIPEINREANGSTNPLRDNFKDKGESK